MKSIFIIPAMLLGTMAIAQKHQAKPKADSFAVTPGTSVHINFNSAFIGPARYDSAKHWSVNSKGEQAAKLYSISNQYKSEAKPISMKDAVYFDPQSQACETTSNIPFFNSRFFIADLEDMEAKSRVLVPASIRFYVPSSHLQPELINMLACDTFPNSVANNYVRPFYFRKYEVTNKEYREFVNYVRDSIGHTRLKHFLPNGNVDFKREMDLYDKATDSITHLLLPKEKRFFSRKQINSDSLVYQFEKVSEHGMPEVLNVYPDTTAWIYDFSYSYNEPMSNFYFWHPAYNDYPVCGVSYWQCLAYLEWKSRILNKQYAKQEIKITCALPSEIEWDYVSTAERVDDKIILMGPAYSNLCDRSWLTDLYVRGDSVRYIIEIKDTSSNKNRSDKSYGREYLNERHDHPLRRFHLSHAVTYGDLILDGYFHTGPAELQAPSRKEEKNYTPEKHRITAYEQYAAHYDNATGISWMDGNVSEWMREDLDRNWRGVFEKHLIVPEGPYMKEEQIIRDYEKMYYDRLPKQGKMVRGCNWFDERFAMHFGKNVEGMQAKTFCDPNAKHCTLGFRYVIYVEGY